jgi:thioesterase domain-containing protein
LAKHPTANITVGGHSLGGALAMYSALSLQLKFNKVTELYTLGQPRLGNA